jgi:hypothetical protein
MTSKLQIGKLTVGEGWVESLDIAAEGETIRFVTEIDLSGVDGGRALICV